MENEVNILAEEKPKVIKLADGKEYILPVINLTSLANIEKTMGVGGKVLAGKMETEPMATLQLFAYAILKESYPAITKDEAGKLITLNELKHFSETITIIMAVG